MDAAKILTDASKIIGERGKSYDSSGRERSMKRTVDAFNAMYNKNLTTEEGWMFMVFLKAARSTGNNHKLDNYLDGAAFFSLAGEEAHNTEVRKQWEKNNKTIIHSKNAY